MSEKGKLVWDTAVAESFLRRLKVEWVYKHRLYRDRKPNFSVVQWIETLVSK